MLRFGTSGDVVWADAGDEPGDGPSIIGWGDALTADALAPGAVAAALHLVETDLAAGTSRPSPLGWYGWIGYACAAHTLGVDPRTLTRPGGTDLAMLKVQRAIVFDHRAQRARLVCDSDDATDAAWRREVTTWWSSAERAPLLPPPPVGRAAARWADSDARYLRLIEECQRAITAGDVYQACLTTGAVVDGVDDDLDAYRRLRRHSPAPHAAFLRIGGTSLLSASPERFLSATPAGRLATSPIKGTRPRADDPAADRLAAAELLESEKERAENLMIVDLMRNDLMRSCPPASVEVTELFAVKSYRHVHQLVSTIEGDLRPGVSPLTAALACFPPGSMTGVPKRRAVQLLAGLEGAPRGAYAGVVGRFEYSGTAELAVVIRTIVIDGGRARIGAGGGITALSDPAAELAEVKTKAAPLLAVLGSR
ncbi:anthranilate synthase component I family protein [Cryobacterium tepidiphilum]|uniref:Anthranilate synthase component I family protein n=2 Tax=Cryobacterium tepidiphilum TaxID=2486026 RepID=A0A3M8LCC2_9MICO|nr:anthranilate synthase component I family protein [Cryobacterium tepidiphilum]